MKVKVQYVDRKISVHVLAMNVYTARRKCKKYNKFCTDKARDRDGM